MTKNMTKTFKNQSFTHPDFVCVYIFHGSQREMLLKNIQIQKSLLILFLHAENNSTNKDTMETCRTVTSS